MASSFEFIPCTYCSLFKISYLCSQTYLNKILVTTQYLFYWIKLLPFAVFVLSTVKLFNDMYDVHAKTAPKSLFDTFAKINTKHHILIRHYLQKNVSLSNSLELKKWKNLLLGLLCLFGILFHFLLRLSTYLIFVKKKNNEIKN